MSRAPGRALHPGAWWLWALGAAAAASRTTNPVLLAMLLAAVCVVVVARRSDAPWARAFRLYLWLGLLVVVLRVLFRVLFGGGGGATVLLDLPTVPLPGSGLQLLGPVSAEALLAGFRDGLRLATMIVCIGAANALADPRRLLKAMPGALYETGTVVVVALSLFPQLAESVLRVRAARRLRGDTGAGRGVRALRGVVVPVLEDALERSLRLAAAMDARGYGRSGGASPAERRLTGVLTVGGLLGVCAGLYATLDATSPRWLAGPVLAAGVGAALLGFVLSGRRVGTTRYRPDRWRAGELVAVACGLGGATALVLAGGSDPLLLHPGAGLTWPSVSALSTVAVLLVAAPALLTPAPPRTVDDAADTTVDDADEPPAASAPSVRAPTPERVP